MYRQVLAELTHKQIKELMVENFGAENSRYHTLDELRLQKLLAKIEMAKCPKCRKDFNPNIHGGKEVNGVWFCLDCYWENDSEELEAITPLCVVLTTDKELSK